jgi:hypothetical protein
MDKLQQEMVLQAQQIVVEVEVEIILVMAAKV